jgi:hypothetical protein
MRVFHGGSCHVKAGIYYYSSISNIKDPHKEMDVMSYLTGEIKVVSEVRVQANG